MSRHVSTRSSKRDLTRGICWILAVVLVSAPGAASESSPSDARVDFHIPPQPLESGLQSYARQAGLQVVFATDLVAGIETTGLVGSRTLESGMTALLDGTGLTFRYDGEETMVVAARRQPQPPQETEPEEEEQPPPDAEPATEEAEAERRAFEEQITVTGSNIPQIEEETALPLTTLDADEIGLRESATTTEILETLPQASGLENNEGSTGPNDARGDASSINLRGLGSQNTLVLFDGRRLPPHPISAGAVPRLTVNVNAVPARALRRVEVLRDGASAIYGTDAAAGVVNLIPKRQTSGRVDVSARYGDSESTSLNEALLSLASGWQGRDGRVSGFVYADGLDRSGLRGGDTDFGADGDRRDRAGSTSTGWDNRSINTPFGRFQTGTLNPDGSFTPAPPPGSDEERFYIGPDGELTFGDLPRDLRFNFDPHRFLIPETERYNAYGAYQYTVGDATTLFAKLNYYRADSLSASAPVAIAGSSNNGLVVPKENFYNPFRGQFDVEWLNHRPVELGSRFAEVESELYRILFGARGLFANHPNWTWETAAAYGEAETVDRGRNMLSESRLRAQLALDTPDAWNVFGTNPPEVLDQVRITTEREGETELGLVDGRLTGLLAELPAGPLFLATGVEARHEAYHDTRDPFSLNDDVIALSETSGTDGDRDVGSGYVELSIPLLADRPLAHGLAVTLAGRYEDYSDFGDTVKPKIGVTWSPASWILARAAYTEGFAAPNLAQLFTGEIVRRNEGTEDPYRADVTGTPADLGDVSRQVIRGGNPNLQPEESETLTAGLAFQPSASQGLFVSLDYWQIEQSDRIATFGQEEQLALDFLLRSTGQGFNEDVVRADPTPEEIAAFERYNQAHPNAPREPAGEILFVRDTFRNFEGREASGWDLAFQYRPTGERLGSLRFSSELTYYEALDEQRDPDSPLLSLLLQNGNPRFRGSAGVSWEREEWGAGLFGSYMSEFEDTSAPEEIEDVPFRVDEWLTFNGYLSHRLRDDLELRLGVNNLFDEEPPLADENNGYFSEYHSPRGRTFVLTVDIEL